jgi:aldose 1-epimerase
MHLDNCFLLDHNEKEVPACVVYNPENGLELKIYADENYPYLQIYTPDNRESIAIENLSGAPDCFNNRMGLLMVKGGEEVKFTVRYRLGKREEK